MQSSWPEASHHQASPLFPRHLPHRNPRLPTLFSLPNALMCYKIISVFFLIGLIDGPGQRPILVRTLDQPHFQPSTNKAGVLYSPSQPVGLETWSLSHFAYSAGRNSMCHRCSSKGNTQGIPPLHVLCVLEKKMGYILEGPKGSTGICLSIK